MENEIKENNKPDIPSIAIVPTAALVAPAAAPAVPAAALVVTPLSTGIAIPRLLS